MSNEKQSEIEKENGWESRNKLRKHILGLFDELNDIEFHNLYGILWSLTAKELLIKTDREKEQKEE